LLTCIDWALEIKLMAANPKTAIMVKIFFINFLLF